MLRGEACRLDAAHLVLARILAGFRLQFAIQIISALVVRLALWLQDAVTLGVDSVAVICRANAVAVIVDDEASFQVADAVALFVYLFALLYGAVDAFVVVGQGSARWTYAFAVWASYEALVSPA